MNIQDNEINVEEIMRKIRENIRRKRATGYHRLDLNLTIGYPLISSDINDAIQCDFSNINSNWDIHNNSYLISSHRPLIGKFLVKGRQIVNGEIRRFIDPVLFQQTEFNASTVRLLNYSLPKIEELKNQLSLQRQELSKGILQQDEKFSHITSQFKDEIIQKIIQQDEKFSHIISQFKDEITQKIVQQDEIINIDIQNYIDTNFKEIFSQVDKNLQLQMGFVHILEERIQKNLSQKNYVQDSVTPVDVNYFQFEERFRGSREMIKQRQLEFLPYFKNCSHVLDIGCGRGEFLEILRDNNIGGIGIDIDANMIAYCKSRHFVVKQGDAIAYLETLDNESLDGIFIDQVVEHFESTYLLQLLSLCYKKLKLGYYIVIETVNPLSFISFINFYIDLTHKRPVHPESLQYLLITLGFRECDKRFFSPVSDESKLKKFEWTADMGETGRKNIDVYNHNVEILNSILFGEQDYAVIGKK